MVPEDVAIQVQNLTKIYKLYESPRDRLKESVNPFGRKYHREFHALRNLNLQIKKGETVGIVGRNGSGKSTLLKIITGVITPTCGTATVGGKISALLELGGGFNPALTGIENVYYNGTLLGFSRAEMDAKLDDILSFADIGAFIHQPVQTYSSGMFVRLAFAVAINVDPDILIVDEALAVGDEAFQRKCFAKIQSFQEQGRTILFVSHTASMVIGLCNRAFLIDSGELLLSGAPKHVMAKYQKLIFAPENKIAELRKEYLSLEQEHGGDLLIGGPPAPENQPTPKNQVVNQPMYDSNLQPKSTESYELRGAVIHSPMITTMEGIPANVLLSGDMYYYTYKVRFEKSADKITFGMMIKTISGFELGGLVSNVHANAIPNIEAGKTVCVKFPFRCTLLPGTYFMNAGVLGIIDGEERYLHRLMDAAMFRVQPLNEKLRTGLIDFSLDKARVEIRYEAE